MQAPSQELLPRIRGIFHQDSSQRVSASAAILPRSCASFETLQISIDATCWNECLLLGKKTLELDIQAAQILLRQTTGSTVKIPRERSRLKDGRGLAKQSPSYSP